MPQLITKKYKVFKFKELSEDVQEKVIENNREVRMNDECYTEQISEGFKETLEERGLPTDTSWSLSNCQGDGVAFYGSIDLVKFLKYNRSYTRFKKLLDNAEVSAKIIGTGYNSFCMNVSVDEYHEWDTYDDELRQAVADNVRGITEEGIDFLREELEEFLQDCVSDVAKELEKSGYDSLDYFYSDEAIKEDIEDKDNQYLEDGEVI